MPPTVSIIIPTLGRGDSLRDCLESLWSQTYQDFEIIKVTEEGELARLRNEGAKRARGRYLVFIDDDVVCSPGWLSRIVRIFEERPDCAGVSGPAVITGQFRRNRDIFSFKFFKFLYDFWFCGRKYRLPGHITESGAWTTGACDESCDYEGEVEFLEACNSAYRADIFHRVGGFDESFRGVGDWSEPDLAFRIREIGYKLWFSRDARLEHRPSKSGAFKKRLSDSRNRLANYELFAKRWVKPHWKHELYKKFLRTYYKIKEFYAS
jgi:GT2 family glycosyltransferase